MTFLVLAVVATGREDFWTLVAMPHPGKLLRSRAYRVILQVVYLHLDCTWEKLVTDGATPWFLVHSPNVEVQVAFILELLATLTAPEGFLEHLASQWLVEKVHQLLCLSLSPRPLTPPRPWGLEI